MGLVALEFNHHEQSVKYARFSEVGEGARMKPAIRKMKDGREVCLDTLVGRGEYRDRMLAMADRQDWLCAICGRAMAGWTLTFDHQAGRGLGGGHRDDRIEVDGNWQNAALHGACNIGKGSKRYEWRDGKYQPVPGTDRS